MQAFETHDATDIARISVFFGPPCLIILSAAWFFLLAKGFIAPRTFVVLMIANIPITVGGVVVIFLAAAGAARELRELEAAAGSG